MLDATIHFSIVHSKDYYIQLIANKKAAFIDSNFESMNAAKLIHLEESISNGFDIDTLKNDFISSLITPPA